MSEPHTITTTRTHVDGKQIIAIEPATGPHPRWPERTAVFQGVTKALLDDESIVYLCDGDGKTPCLFVGDRTKSVVAHANSTHRRRAPRNPTMYSDETVKQVVLQVERAKREGIKGYCGAAAAALNGMRVPTKRGVPWTAGSISDIYSRHGHLVKVRLPKPRTSATRAAERVRVVAANNGHAEGIQPGDLESLKVFVKIVGPGPLGDALQRLLAAVQQPSQPDPVLVEKARKYDELQALLNR